MDGSGAHRLAAAGSCAGMTVAPSPSAAVTTTSFQPSSALHWHRPYARALHRPSSMRPCRARREQLASWSQAAGLPFVSAPAWHWERATAAAFAAAPDFLEGDPPAATMASGSRAVRWFRPALVLATLALGIHFGALLVQWGWLNLVDWRLSQALVAQATAAGMTSATTPLAASAAIARQNADLRHRASRSAPTDALPLLARAAPSIARLPGGSLKSATYANDAWTIELVKLDAQAVSRVTRALGLVGVDAVSAPIAGGTRMRLTLDATAR